jgi:zinc transporter, ZIP family
MYNVNLGWTTTIAIALHNIPEGIAIAVPCLVARPESPCLAFCLASVSGLFEPFGAALALWLFQEDKNNNSPKIDLKNILSFVAGIMIMVAVLDLFPEALKHSQPGKRLPLYLGTVIGVVVMLASEAYLSS